MTSENTAVFLSYASQDAEAARRICESLRAAGVEVWLDQEGGLVGGDAWDAKIRGQIAACALFVPLVSANTQARREGYFRLEWKLADERTHLMAEGTPFLLPVVIDDTKDREALVPKSFLSVQWTRLRPVGFGGQARNEPALEAFCARVKTLLSGDGVARAFQRVETVERENPTRSKPRPTRRGPRLWLALAATIAIGATATFIATRPSSLSTSSNSKLQTPNSKPTDLADAKSVAVLPFANLSNDPEQEYFSDGLTEEILNALARERDLRVPGRASAFSFKGKNVSSAEIARTLNVARLVEGSVRKQGTRVRIGVTLTRAADGFSEELGTFTEELTDIFALQDKVARAVVEKVTRRTTTAGAAVLTKNTEAYDAYLRGRTLQMRAAGTNAREAAAHYERAVALDPAFALAWARLAEIRFRPYRSGNNHSPAVVTDTRTAIDRALTAQPNLPEAFIVRANWSLWVESDFVAARRDLAHAGSLQPPTAELRQAEAFLARELNDWPEAQRLAREALSLDPQNGDYTSIIALAFFSVRGEFAEADRLVARAMAIQGPGASGPFSNRVSLRMRWRGPAAALRLVERAPAGQAGVERVRAEVLVELGRLDEARALIDAIEKRDPAITQAVAIAQSSRQSDRAYLDLLQAVGYDALARHRAEEIRADALKEFERDNRAPGVRANLIRAEIALGHTAAALAALEEWRRETAALPSGFRRFFEFGRLAATLYALAGRADEALALLREAQAGGLQFTSYLSAAELRPLRADPRFQEVFGQADAWAKAQPDPVDL